MTSEEIEEAMARANGKAATVSTTTTTSSVPQGAMVQQPGMMMQHAPPPLPPRPAYDWRDIFIAAVLAGGVGYGVWTLAKVSMITADRWSKPLKCGIVASLWPMVPSAHTERIGGRQGEIRRSIPSR